MTRIARTSDERSAGRTRAVAYLRCSTEKQSDHGVSLDVQRAKIRAFADLYDLDLVSEEVDAGESARTLDRPALRRALAMLDGGTADAVVVVKLDRLTRKVVDLGMLLDRYFRHGQRALLSVSEQIDTRTAAGRLVLNLLASVAEWEREAIGERTAAAMRHKASLGEYIGGAAPYGWRVGPDSVRLEPHPEEQAVLAEARALRATGLSLRAVAAALAFRGFRARSGRPFAPSAIARMAAGS